MGRSKIADDRRALGFTLPASTERFIEGDDSEQLVALRAGKIELRGKELLLRFENLLIAGFAGHVTF